MHSHIIHISHLDTANIYTHTHTYMHTRALMWARKCQFMEGNALFSSWICYFLQLKLYSSSPCLRWVHGLQAAAIFQLIGTLYGNANWSCTIVRCTDSVFNFDRFIKMWLILQRNGLNSSTTIYCSRKPIWIAPINTNRFGFIKFIHKYSRNLRNSQFYAGLRLQQKCWFKTELYILRVIHNRYIQFEKIWIDFDLEKWIAFNL